MDIEDFLANRVGGDYGKIRSDPEYRKCSKALSEVYKSVVDKAGPTGEKIIDEIRSLHNIMSGVSNLFSYKKGLKDGLRLGELLALTETQVNNETL